MATSILPEVAPLPTKDVRRNKETRDFDAYVIFSDGTEAYLGSRERSWDAETLCDEAVHEILMRRPVVAPEPIEALPFDLTAAELEHEACIGAESVFTMAAGPARSTSHGVCIERDVDDKGTHDEVTYISYGAGKTALRFCESPASGPDTSAFLDGLNNNSIAPHELRDLYTILSHPDVQRWMGITPPTPSVPSFRVEVELGDDDFAPDQIGKPIATTFVVNNGGKICTDEYIELSLPANCDPKDKPTLLLMREAIEDVEAFARLAPQALALLNAPEVKKARKQWAAGLTPVSVKAAA